MIYIKGPMLSFRGAVYLDGWCIIVYKDIILGTVSSMFGEVEGHGNSIKATIHTTTEILDQYFPGAESAKEVLWDDSFEGDGSKIPLIINDFFCDKGRLMHFTLSARVMNDEGITAEIPILIPEQARGEFQKGFFNQLKVEMLLLAPYFIGDIEDIEYKFPKDI